MAEQSNAPHHAMPALPSPTLQAHSAPTSQTHGICAREADNVLCLVLIQRMESHRLCNLPPVQLRFLFRGSV